MQNAELFYTHTRSAIFNGYLALEWKAGDSDICFFDRCRECEAGYNEAIKYWIDLSNEWPKQSSSRVGWVAKRSTAEAALLWLQDIALAILSLRSHYDENGPLTADECHRLLVDSLVEWHELVPKHLMTERMDVLARLDAEYEQLTLLKTPITEVNGPEKKSTVVLTVERWEDLSIGLAADSNFYAVVERVTLGSCFPKAKSTALRIPDGKLRELLILFANSLQVGQVPLADCLSPLKLLPPEVAVAKERKARREELESATEAELPAALRASLVQVKNTIKELRRQFTDQVDGPKGTDLCFELDELEIKFKFSIQVLIPTDDRRAMFGQKTGGHPPTSNETEGKIEE